MHKCPVIEMTFLTKLEFFPRVFQGQTDLLRGAKLEALDAVRQLTLACEASGLTSPSPN